MFGYVSIAQLSADIRANVQQIPDDIDLVVGIPRSGMIPAYMIGLFGNREVTDLESFLANGKLGHGRRKVGVELSEPLAARHVLLVDDSLCLGSAMQACVDRISAAGFRGRLTTCAAIVVPDRHHAVDIHFRQMQLPRIFEWNALHHSNVKSSCFALDGLLCHRPPMRHDDSRFGDWLQNARPLFRPTGVIGHIVSERPQRYLDETKRWLDMHGIAYRNLHLSDVAGPGAYASLSSHASYKARIYGESRAVLFYEGDPAQASLIATTAGRAVMCIGDMDLYLPQSVAVASSLRHARWLLRKPFGRTKVWLRRVFAPVGRT